MIFLNNNKEENPVRQSFMNKYIIEKYNKTSGNQQIKNFIYGFYRWKIKRFNWETKAF